MNSLSKLLISLCCCFSLEALAGPVGQAVQLGQVEQELQEIDHQFAQAFKLHKQNKNDESSKAVLKAYRFAAGKLGGDYRLSDYAYYVAALHQNTGKYDIAEKYHRINLDIKKKHLQFPNGQLIIAYNNVASVLNLHHKYKEALHVLSRVDVEINKEYESALSFVYSNRASAYFGLKDLKKAREYITKSAPLIEKYFGTQSTTYADSNFFLARMSWPRETKTELSNLRKNPAEYSGKKISPTLQYTKMLKNS